LINRYSAMATAEMWNEKGGYEIGGEKYQIEIVSVDDRNDPKLTVQGAERLTASEGIRYIIGPNTDVTATSVRPVAEKNKAIYFPYAFNKSLYIPPAGNAVLGMIASYQAGPIIYEYLRDKQNVKKIAFVTRNDSDGITQRDEGVKAAEQLGLEVVSSDTTYEADVTDFFPVLSNVVGTSPDLIVFSAVTPAHGPQMIRTARELGFEGPLATETAQDIKIINEVAGDYANGFVSVGGASTPEIRSAYMEEFIKRYNKVAGEWNDEAGTKAYALEMILATLAKAGPAAIDDIEPFKAAIPTFSMRNPFLKEEAQLTYVGEKDFGQKRQIGVPMVVNVVENGAFKTLFIGKVA
jgi:branched-chain amino acid transport system substrate-binding protein